MFDQEPDGDPHGECAAEIHRLEKEVASLRLAARPSACAPSAPDEALMRQAVEALEAANNGLQWYRDEYPDDVNGCDDEADAEIESALAALRARLAAPSASAWIAVSERLPTRAPGKDESDEVLCWTDSGRAMVHVCFYEHQHKDYDYGQSKVPAFQSNITHWQPVVPPAPETAPETTLPKE